MLFPIRAHALVFFAGIGILWLQLAAGRSWGASSELSYLSNADLQERLSRLAAEQPAHLRLTSMGKTIRGHSLWMIELGQGSTEERRNRPALLLVGGIEGNDLTSTSLAVAWIEHLLAGNGELPNALLDSTTLYVIPRLNPDAAESFFRAPRFERAVTPLPVDDDHDGLVDEDGPEDLNGDGLITWMRVQDPEGEFILDPSDPRLLLKADRARGEAGSWRLMVEGRDDDADEAWNEDGVGGVNLNRNFPYNYQFFGPSAGRHPVSEMETRALADFVVNHPNIGIVLTFGAADNLVHPPKGESGGKRPPTAHHDDDVPYYRELGKEYRDALGIKKEFSTRSEPGTFSDWIYFHRGRLSLAARPWSPELAMELFKADTEKAKEKAGSPADSKPGETPEAKSEAEEKDKAPPDKRNEEERNYLKWVEHFAPGGFISWSSHDHPDFPGRTVEIGGFAPFAKSNPPEKLLVELARRQNGFLTGLLGKLPRVGLQRSAVKHLGESVYDITLWIVNTGYLPTSLAQGGITREVLRTRVVLDLPAASFLSGSPRILLGAIPGSGGTHEIRYVIHAPSQKKIETEIQSALGGSVRAVIELGEQD